MLVVNGKMEPVVLVGELQMGILMLLLQHRKVVEYREVGIQALLINIFNEKDMKKQRVWRLAVCVNKKNQLCWKGSFLWFFGWNWGIFSKSMF